MRTLFAKLKGWIALGLEKARHTFVVESPGKNRPNLKTIGYVVTSGFLVFAIFFCIFGSSGDTSRLTKATVSIRETFIGKPIAEMKQPNPKGVTEAAQEEKPQKRALEATQRRSNINFHAKQVLERPDYTDPDNTLPTGTEFIGRLLSAVDTRQPTSLVKIEVPYGGAYQGNELLPKGVILMAAPKYDGNGEKVFLEVQSGVYPSGGEFKIRGQALSARDYSPGIEGDYHGTFSNRVAATMGLTFVSGLTDALIDRQSLGSGSPFMPSSVAAKPTLANGLLTGVSKVSESESQRLGQELQGQKAYVTVESGKEVIISLLERFVRNK